MTQQKAPKQAGSRKKRPNSIQIQAKISELAKTHDYDEGVLWELAAFVSAGKFPEPSMKELKEAVIAVFKCDSYEQLKQHPQFKQAIAGKKFNAGAKKSWLELYQNWVESPPEGIEIQPFVPAPSLKELKEAVIAAFKCSSYTQLKKNPEFKLAIAGKDLNFSKKDSWLVMYREWVGVPANERNEQGETCINGIDVLKNFRPWHVFELDPEVASADDINQAYRRLAQQHHPDKGGDRRVFEELTKMRDSILAFR